MRGWRTFITSCILWKNSVRLKLDIFSSYWWDPKSFVLKLLILGFAYFGIDQRLVGEG